MNNQVPVDRALLERMRDVLYLAACSETGFSAEAECVGTYFPELLTADQPRAMVAPDGYVLIGIPLLERMKDCAEAYVDIDDADCAAIQQLLAAAPAPKGDSQ